MKSVFQPLVLGAAIACAIACGSTDTSRERATMPELSEASMNFDLETLSPFLGRVEGLLDSGLGQNEIARLVGDVSAMPVDAEQQWSYEIVFGGEPAPLQIRVFMDDIEAPDVAFFSTQNVAEAIEQEMIKFADELGI